MEHYVVVGGGQAGHSLAARLRRAGFAGALTLVCGEPLPPYQRPPLSKGYLLGKVARDRLFLRPESYYAEAEIALRIGCAATGIDRERRLVTLSDGGTLAYDKLALATGAAPIRLPAAAGGDLPGVHTIRTAADIDRLSAALAETRRLVVVGGGYVGLEAAAAAATLGKSATVLEGGARLLQRVASPEVAAHFLDLHRSRGVRIETGAQVERLEAGAAGLDVVLRDGRRFEADRVILGIGARPETRLAEAAGLALEDGIAVDDACRTSDPAIWAAGDCASFLLDGRRTRLESVGGAIDMAECAAANMAGEAQVHRPKPWFWSDQFDAKLQMAGLPDPGDRVVRRAGARGGRSFWRFRRGRLAAIEAIDDPAAYAVGKRVIEGELPCDPARIADPDFTLRSLIAPGAA